MQNADTAAPGGGPEYTRWCLDKGDLCAAELCAFWERTATFVAPVVRSSQVDREIILARLTGVDEHYRSVAERAISWRRSFETGMG